jgi:hypothetical protein
VRPIPSWIRGRRWGRSRFRGARLVPGAHGHERLKRREFLEIQLTAAQALKDTDFAADGGLDTQRFRFRGGARVSLDAGGAQLAKLGKARDAQRIRNQQEMDTKDQEILLAFGTGCWPM